MIDQVPTAPKVRFVSLTFALFVSLFSATLFAQDASPIKLDTFLKKPKLVLVVVIDQFRADYLTRFVPRFMPTKGKTAPGGFRFLMESGAYFPFAEYDVLQNMTCPGHAMILTGSLPFETRIPANEWYDHKSEKFIYCVDDAESPIVGVEPSKKNIGASPRRLRTSTVGDELKNAGYKSRVVTVALKDRSAIMLGGRRADLATWFDQKKRRWISSGYYLPEGKLPEWLEKENQSVAKKTAAGQYTWEVKSPATGLSHGKVEANFKRTFEYTDDKVLSSPYGLDVTTDAAIAALKGLKLGQGKDTDVLALSYSSHDSVGHVWGPNSREMEEMTIAEDRTLNDLFKAVQKEVPGGLKNTLVVLTADHGMAPSVPYAKEARFDAFEVLYDDMLAKMNTELNKIYGPPPAGDWVVGVRYFNFYLNKPAILEKKLKQMDLERIVKDIVLKEGGIIQAFTASDYDARTLPPVTFTTQIMNSYIPGINGEVVAIPAPFSYFEKHPTHITGYAYDRTVPLILVGDRMKAGVYPKTAKVVDLAPTLSFILGVLPPATNEGRVLVEALAR